jgi:hypothetical protein
MFEPLYAPLKVESNTKNIQKGNKSVSFNIRKNYCFGMGL